MASAWGLSWGTTAPPPVPSTDTHDGFGRHADRYIEEVRDRLRRAEEARDRSVQERKAAAKQLRKALERAYHGIAEEAPEEAAIVAAAATPAQPVKRTEAGAILPPEPTRIDWAAFAADLDRVGKLLGEIEVRRAKDEALRTATLARDAMLAADEDDIELLLLAL